VIKQIKENPTKLDHLVAQLLINFVSNPSHGFFEESYNIVHQFVHNIELRLINASDGQLVPTEQLFDF
jgi:hypothetical protein